MSIRTNLNKASPHSFELIFPKIPVESDISDKNELVLNIHSTVIPSITIDSLDLPWQGGVAKTFGGITYEPWFVQYIVDSNFQNWILLYNWVIYINNNKNKYGDKHKKFQVDGSLRITDNFEKTIMTVDFKNIWPNNVGEVQLSHREGEPTLQSTTNFMYDRYEITELNT